MISIYTGKEQERGLLDPTTCCTYCTEQAGETVDGMPLCGIPGNHENLELSQSQEIAA